MSTTVFNLMKVSLILLLAIGCTTLLPPTFTPAVPPATTSAPFTPSVTPINNVLTQTLTMGEYQYTMECSGEGSPVVLLLGGRAAAWKPIQAEINRITRNCTFDHMGNSPTPLMAEEIAKNVHLLLKDADVTAPYVLVGFSVGGYITRLFANLYLDEVVGMVLLDSSHADQNARFLAALPPETSNDCQELKDYRAELQGPHIIPMAPQISLDFDASADDVRGLEENLGNLPLVVRTAGRSEWPDCFPVQVQQHLDQAWLDMQDDLASLSTNSVHIVAKESGHAFDDPAGMQAVIEAIQRVIDAVRNGGEVSIP